MKIKGTKQADLLSSTADNDIIKGGKGRDTLVAGEGVDTLIGGKGRDTFILPNDGGAVDYIIDFDHGKDRIIVDVGLNEAPVIKNDWLIGSSIDLRPEELDQSVPPVPEPSSDRLIARVEGYNSGDWTPYDLIAV